MSATGDDSPFLKTGVIDIPTSKVVKNNYNTYSAPYLAYALL
jgi:hypothetical protein